MERKPQQHPEDEAKMKAFEASFYSHLTAEELLEINLDRIPQEDANMLVEVAQLHGTGIPIRR